MKASVARLVSLTVSVVVVGCGGHPQSYMSPIEMGHNDAYSCTMQFLNESGYTVKNADKESGIVQARQESSGLVEEAFTGERTWQVISVSIFEGASEESNEAEQRMNVTAAQASQGVFADALGTGSIEEGGTPSDETKKDAKNLIEECGGTVTSTEDSQNSGYQISAEL